MRDYNTIPFKAPRSASKAPVEEKKDGSTIATTDEISALSTADALALRRDGAEATVLKLRQSLEQAETHEASAQAALAKSEATVLELKSTARQLRRQLEQAQQQQQAANNRTADQEQRDSSPWEQDVSNDTRIADLQVQLDRAHAQILTADMVRKELEDTLEAEQYTWDLRVQDQERQIEELQDECRALAEDLEQCRMQWKEAEDKWQKDGGSDTLRERVEQLEHERGELQGCLDEALKELEAVDQELQGDSGAELRAENERLRAMLKEDREHLLEPLQHMYRLVMETNGGDHRPPEDELEIIQEIQKHLEDHPNGDGDLAETRRQVRELESQISVYRGDLQAREESSAELRASLKEAVALLKPLQDAVAKADKEKATLREQIKSLQSEGVSARGADLATLRASLAKKDDEIDGLKQEIESLEIQLSQAKLAAATSVVATQRDVSDRNMHESVQKTRDELKAKRAAEKTLKQLLQDAQTRFNTLHQQSQEVEAMNSELQSRLKSAEQQLVIQPSTDTDNDRSIEFRERTMLENEIKELRGQLAEKDLEIKNIQEEKESQGGNRLKETEAQVDRLETKLSVKNDEIRARKESERALNRSLKEALNLLRPLQTHLEEAEKEKRALSRELQALKTGGRSTLSAPVSEDSDSLRELRETVRQLERENTQLHDALEDMSQSINASQISGMTGLSQKNEGRLREEIVELKSRYEVTQDRLNDSYVENRSLSDALKTREQEEHKMSEEVRALKEKLKQTQAELENAKFIASTALMDKESRSSVPQDREVDYLQRARQVEQEIRSKRTNGRRPQYRLT